MIWVAPFRCNCCRAESIEVETNAVNGYSPCYPQQRRFLAGDVADGEIRYRKRVRSFTNRERTLAAALKQRSKIHLRTSSELSRIYTAIRRTSAEASALGRCGECPGN